MSVVSSKVGSHVERIKPDGLVLIHFRLFVVSEPGVGHSSASVGRCALRVYADGRGEVSDRHWIVSTGCVRYRSPEVEFSVMVVKPDRSREALDRCAIPLGRQMLQRLVLAFGCSCYGVSLRFAGSAFIHCSEIPFYFAQARGEPGAGPYSLSRVNARHECTLS